MTLKEYLKNSKVFKTSRESNQQRRESSSRKSRTQKVNASLLAKESPIPLESFTRDFTKTVKKNNSEQEESDEERIPEITSEEIQAAICKLKSGKSPDGNGIRAEDIKDCNEETREMMRQVFNEVTKRNNFTPEEWKKSENKSDPQER